MRKTLSVLSVLAAACAAIGVANAADKTLDAETAIAGETFGSWRAVCKTGRSCQTYVNLANPKTKRLALTASFHFVKGTPDLTGVVQLPLGVALNPGVRIYMGADESDAITLTPEVCYPDGCRAVFSLSPERLATFLAAEDYEVRFFTYIDQDHLVSMKVPTDGLGDALAHIALKADKQQADKQEGDKQQAD